MPTKYLLPCPKCPPGVHIIIDSAQAGLMVRCQCGAEVQAPTMRGLSQLARVTEEASAAESSWTWRESLILLGVVLAVAMLPTLGFIRYKQPPHPSTFVPLPPVKTPDGRDVEDDISRMNIEQIWDLWGALQQDLDSGEEELVIRGYERQMAKHAFYYYLADGVLALGLVLAAVGVIARIVEGKRGAG